MASLSVILTASTIWDKPGFTEELNNAIYCATFGLVGHFGFLSFELVVQ